MKYYVVSDVHGFYTAMKKALMKAGFFEEKEPHKLVVCGDMMDRGAQAREMQEFMMQMLREDKLIYIRGNHEDLLEAMVTDIAYRRPVSEVHEWNGTWDTAVQLSGLDSALAARYPMEVARRLRESDFWHELLPASVDFFETEHYVFVHGWIPCYDEGPCAIEFDGELHCRPDWREATVKEWRKARWFNGMECACILHYGVPDKTVVCGHWHTSYGHAKIEHKGSEEGGKADFSPFYAKGIIALDACTACTGKVNCIVLEDEEI